MAAAPAVGSGAFTIASLTAACKGWSPAVRLGQRETCETYRGVLPSGTPIAVQRVRTVSGQAWQAELDEMMRSNVSHPNIVQLLGLTSDGPTACVVYAYMDGGSLADVLHAAQLRRLAADRVLRVDGGEVVEDEGHVDDAHEHGQVGAGHVYGGPQTVCRGNLPGAQTLGATDPARHALPARHGMQPSAEVRPVALL